MANCFAMLYFPLLLRYKIHELTNTYRLILHEKII